MSDKPIKPTERSYLLHELIDASNIRQQDGQGNDSFAYKLNQLANWIDAIHSRKFANPDVLNDLAKDQAIASILDVHLSKWKILNERLEQLIENRNKELILLFQKMRGWLKPVLFYYIIFTASLLWIGRVPINWPPMTIVSTLILIFLIAIYAYRIFFEKRWFGPHLNEIIKELAIDDQLRDTVQDLIYTLHREILINKFNPTHFTLVFGNGDYKGITWTVKPNLTTSDTFEGHPYPLYSIISAARKNLRIVLPRFDPVLLSSLKDVNPNVYIKLLVSEGILKVRRFAFVCNYLITKKKLKLKVRSTALKNIGNHLLIISDNDMWNEQNETKGLVVKRTYSNIEDEEQEKAFNNLFNRSWESGIRFESQPKSPKHKAK